MAMMSTGRITEKMHLIAVVLNSDAGSCRVTFSNVLVDAACCRNLISSATHQIVNV